MTVIPVIMLLVNILVTCIAVILAAKASEKNETWLLVICFVIVFFNGVAVAKQLDVLWLL